MFVAFFESAKYVGHLYPIALMRIYMGYYFLNMSLMRFTGEFLNQPRLAHIITESLPQRDLPSWYVNLLQNVVVPNWRFFAYFITYCEFIIGVTFLIGFLVRPAALLGVFLMINFVYAGGGSTGALSIDLQQTFMALFIVMFWVGAGRCFGFDFYFYKRQRGLWW